MFTELYLQTTNPKLTFDECFTIKTLPHILISTIFHTMIYVSFSNLFSYIFFGTLLSKIINLRLFLILILIMFFGFFARFLHVKEVYRAYDSNLEKTRNHLDRLYIGWIFIS